MNSKKSESLHTGSLMQLQDQSLVSSLCYINGKWVGTPETKVINPANQKVIALVPNMGEEETHTAIQYAYKALEKWQKKTAKQRAQILRKWYELIIQAKDDLAMIMTLEQGKPLAEAKDEIEYASAFVEFYSEQAKRVLGEIIPQHNNDSRILILKQPIGVVGAITPWNFPSAMLTRKICPAIAVGCTVVCKPAPDTPLSALALAKLAHRAGVPPGVINIITGKEKEIGRALTQSKYVRAITFTGSTNVGKMIIRQSADTVKKLSLELGGNAAFIVFEDADVDMAVKGAIASKFRNAGQTCVCANRIFVHNYVYQEFCQKFVQQVRELKVGDGLHENVKIGPLINQQAIDKVKRHIKEAVDKGAKIAVGGKQINGIGNFFQPTVLTEVTQNMPFSFEETFGPVAPISRFDDEKEIVDIANQTPYGLASYFYSRDISRIFRVAEKLENGIVGVNSGVTSSEMIPFGGIKESGIGREGSHHGVEEFLEIKYIYLGGIG